LTTRTPSVSTTPPRSSACTWTSGLLRGRYGLRALRLGLQETGHLAHSLILVATALGLSSTPINGFNDELCHQLFGLDDIDEPLQYLLPIGRCAPRDR
jgi:hypothetical protein